MRYWIFLSLLLLTGCQSIVGPRNRQPQRVDDPRYTIQEQERRGRDRLPNPDGTYLAGPAIAVTPSAPARTQAAPTQ